jgi:hypothetical protein
MQVTQHTPHVMPHADNWTRRLVHSAGQAWGPVTSTLVGGGRTPRYVIGSVNLTEFFVTVATSTTFALALSLADLAPVIPLILGGLVTAPFAGYLTRVIPTTVLVVTVGCVVLGLSGRSLLKLASWV